MPPYLSFLSFAKNTPPYVQPKIRHTYTLGGDAVDKTAVLAWNEKLSKGYAATSVNSMLAAVNGFFDWLDLPQLKVSPVENPAGDFCTARKGTDAAGIRPPCESGTRTAQ